ncbi:MAG TPA: VWA domain-containing protein [Acidimicrobiales bacterium]
MSFLSPGWLWLLAALPLLGVAYAALQRRRRHRAVRYPNLDLLASVAPKRAGWRRHASALTVALTLATLVVALARPARDARVAREAATVMLVLDTSASMSADDVEPSRMEAAVEAARGFIDDLPDLVEVGLVAFDRTTRVVATPTTDHAAVISGLGELAIGPGTAAGDGVAAALDAIRATAPAQDGRARDEPSAAIVLLSDGVTTVGRPVLVAAEAAAAEGIPVNTIAFGTDDGVVAVQGRFVSVPADPITMAAVAEATGGTFFEAVSMEELRSVYEDIGTRVGWDVERRDATSAALAVASGLLVVACALGLVWAGRLA